MSEPRRLKDDPGMEAMLLRSADDDAPPEGTRRALAIAIGLAPLPVPPPVGPAAAAGTGAAPTVATTVAAKAGLGIVAKTAIGLAVATGVGVGVKTAVQQPRITTTTIVSAWRPYVDRAAEQPAPAPVATPPQVAVAPPPIAEPPAVAPAPAVTPPPIATRPHAVAPAPIETAPPAEAPAPPAPPPPVVVTPPPAPKATLTDEITLIDGALSALRRHDPRRALALLDDYDTRYPTGAMAPEAAVARIQATIGTGDAAKARELGAQFLAAHPTSPLAGRVRDLISHAP